MWIGVLGCFGRDNFWALEASPSNYEVDDARLGARRGGVAMCIQ